MKRMALIILCLLLSVSVLFCSCGTSEYIPTEDAEYQLVYEWGALVLKENGKTVDSWKARDVFAISGDFMAYTVTTVQGKKPVRAFFRDLFGEGVSMTLISSDFLQECRPSNMTAVGISYEDIARESHTYGLSTEGLQAIFVLADEYRAEGLMPFVFVDRYGNCYRSDAEALSSLEIERYLVENYLAISVEHEE